EQLLGLSVRLRLLLVLELWLSRVPAVRLRGISGQRMGVFRELGTRILLRLPAVRLRVSVRVCKRLPPGMAVYSATSGESRHANRRRLDVDASTRPTPRPDGARVRIQSAHVQSATDWNADRGLCAVGPARPAPWLGW